MRAFFIGLILMLSLSATAAAAQDADLAILQSQIRDMVNSVDDWSLGVAIINENGPVWVEGIGKGNLANGADVDENSLFRIGSISKMFVGLTALKLIEQGQITLDTKLVDIAPEIPLENRWHESHPLTLRHFLEHTSGWEDIHLTQFKSYLPEMSLQQGITFHPDSQVSRWPPGTAYSYSNANTSIAAYMLQKVSGTDYETLVQQLIFDPMEMTSATYRLDDKVKSRGVNLIEDYTHIAMRPSGAVNISPTDLAKVVELLLNKGFYHGKRLLSENSIKMMETPTSSLGARAGIEIGYGLANSSKVYEHVLTQGHSGAIGQNVANLQYFPESKSGFVLMANKTQMGKFRDIEKRLKDYLVKDLTPPEIPQGVAVDEDTRAIEGYYYPVNYRNEWIYFAYWIMSVQHFYFEGDELHSQAAFGGQVDKFLAINQQQFISKQSGLIELARFKDDIAGQGIIQHSTLFVPINPIVWVALLLTLALALVSMALSTIYGILLSPLSLYKALAKSTQEQVTVTPPSMRRWPLLASAAFVVSFLMFFIGINDALVLLASPSWASVGLCIGTVVFAILTWLAVYQSTRLFSQRANIKFYWYWSLVAFVQLIFSIYLTWHGFIGIMTWR